MGGREALRLVARQTGGPSQIREGRRQEVRELAEDGAKALAFVIVGIMIYRAIRFEWKFAVAAIIAHLHDAGFGGLRLSHVSAHEGAATGAGEGLGLGASLVYSLLERRGPLWAPSLR